MDSRRRVQSCLSSSRYWPADSGCEPILPQSGLQMHSDGISRFNWSAYQQDIHINATPPPQLSTFFGVPDLVYMQMRQVWFFGTSHGSPSPSSSLYSSNSIGQALKQGDPILVRKSLNPKQESFLFSPRSYSLNPKRIRRGPAL